MYTCKALLVIERRGRKLRCVAYNTFTETAPEKWKKLSGWVAEGWFLGSETRSLVNFEGQMALVMTKMVAEPGDDDAPAANPDAPASSQ